MPRSEPSYSDKTILQRSTAGDAIWLEQALGRGAFENAEGYPERCEAALQFITLSRFEELDVESAPGVTIVVLAMPNAVTYRPFFRRLSMDFLAMDIQPWSAGCAALLMRAACALHDLSTLKTLHAMYPQACNEMVLDGEELSTATVPTRAYFNIYAWATRYSFVQGMDHLRPATRHLHYAGERRGQSDGPQPISIVGRFGRFITYDALDKLLANARAEDEQAVLQDKANICAAARVLCRRATSEGEALMHSLWVKHGFYRHQHHLYARYLARNELKTAFTRFYSVAMASDLDAKANLDMHAGILVTSIYNEFVEGIELALKGYPPKDLSFHLPRLILQAKTFKRPRAARALHAFQAKLTAAEILASAAVRLTSASGQSAG